MKIVILCGGQGTRIRGVSDNLPKPMIPIGDFPILWHLMKSYAAAGHNEFILCLGYKGHVIKEFFLNYEAFTNDFTLTLGRDKEISFHGDHDESGWKVTCAETGADTMTGGRINRIKRYIGDDEHFMLTYGDGVSDIDDSWFAEVETVMITAGASAPDVLVEDCVDYIKQRFSADVELRTIREEEVHFNLPKELVKLL